MTSTHHPTQHARLPSFSILQRSYINGRPDQVKSIIGRHLNTPDLPDTCVMRMSWILNHINIVIPGYHQSPMLTLSGDPIGGHKQWYAIRHSELRDWLLHQIGPPQISKKGRPILLQDFAQFQGKTAKGIIVLDVAYAQHPNQANATGHIDLWDGQHFTEDSERGKEPQTFAAASRADLWIAPD